MTSILLFCIAEEAKPFIHELLKPKAEQDQIFYLVESRAGPHDGEAPGLRDELKNDEPFETDFIGASIEDCQKWALDMMRKSNSIYDQLIAIVDARSAQDATISIYFWNPKDTSSSSSSSSPVRLDFGDFGILPPEEDKWYEFRIEHGYAVDLFADLGFAVVGNTFPVYFGRKEELTDERGVFDMRVAGSLVEGGGSEGVWVGGEGSGAKD